MSAKNIEQATAVAGLSLDEARLQLSRLHAGVGTPLRELWLKLARLTSAALNVERVGVWVLAEGGRAIRCRYLLQRSGDQIFQGTLLLASDFPGYFKALTQMRIVCAADAVNSEATRELLPAYLAPLGITSMLDSPIFLDGELAGVVCHEHIGPMRTWSDAECDFAAAVADNIARLYREHERHSSETTLHGYQRRLMELHRMEAVGRMAVGIAHDFRGLLGTARGFAELIVRAPDDGPRVKHLAERIVETLHRGDRLTREVMEFGKTDESSPRLLDVAGLLRANATMLQTVVGDSIALHLELTANLGRVLMDSSQLERALLNLVLNARDAMPTGGQLTIAATENDGEDNEGEECTCIVIAVTDTGVGMDERTLSNIFKPFFTTKGEQGTGLGLPIVDQIVARAGGFVRVASTLHEGTTVRLHLPRIAAPS